MPHFAYARSDQKDAPRISIGARLVADLLVSAAANRVLASRGFTVLSVAPAPAGAIRRIHNGESDSALFA